MMTQTEMKKIVEQVNEAFSKLEKRIEALEKASEKTPVKRVTKTTK